MNRTEIVVLLTLAAAFDYRKVGDADVEAWYLALDDIALDDAKQAVVAHYRETRERLMPSDVRQIVRDKVAAEKRANRQPPPALALTSRFEPDEVRGLKLARGQAMMAEVLGPLAAKLAEGRRDRERQAAQVWDELRQVTAGPDWPEQDAPAAIEGGAA